MQTISQSRHIQRYQAVIPIGLGVALFFLIIGPRALDPQNIAWLNHGDPATHYLGWLFYRKSDWSAPLGANPTYGLELASTILFSDSNPLLAFLFKPFSQILPETFQYFGIWLLLCFTLQTWFGWQLMGFTTHSKLIRLLGAALIAVTPFMLKRTAHHLSLAGHFFIVAALYFSLHEKLKFRTIKWTILLTTAALTHAYLLAMTFAIWGAEIIGKTTKKNISFRNALTESLIIAFTLFIALWQTGYFSVQSPNAGGFGIYQVNVLSPIDPNDWSYIIKDLALPTNDLEGFIYLGLGVLLLAILASTQLLTNENKIPFRIRQHWSLLTVLLGLGLFALSNKISFGSFEFEYYLSEQLLSTANIFRASGRFAWPVLYAAIFLSLAIIIRTLNKRSASLIIAFALTAQILDTYAGWKTIREKMMIPPSTAWPSSLTDTFWTDAAQRYKKVVHIPAQNHPPKWKDIAYYAGTNDLSTNAVYLARTDNKTTEDINKKYRDMLQKGHLDKDTLYVLDEKFFKFALVSANTSTDLFTIVNGMNIIAPGWKKCATCHQPDDISIHDLLRNVHAGDRLIFQKSKNGIAYLGDGWSVPEPWGTWSLGESASIILPTTTSSIESISIEAKALISEVLPAQRIEIFVNDIPTQTLVLTSQSSKFGIPIPREIRSSSAGWLKIDFRFLDATRPKDIGMSNDARALALGLISASIN